MRTLSFLFFVFMILRLPAQENVKLVSWNVGQCDENSDPYRLINRISAIGFTGNELHMTIGFRDNCCPHFNPAIRYSGDTLFIQTYVWDGKSEGSFAMCSCDCCFSMDFVISGLRDTSFITMFKDKRIVYSAEPYKTYPPKYELLNNDTINRVNRYGVEYGFWIERYESGELMREVLFSGNSSSINSTEIRTKVYFKNGNLSYYSRNDSIESWHENGQLKLLKYDSTQNGDMLETEITYYPTGIIHNYQVFRIYSDENRKKDTLNHGAVIAFYERKESYYPNGQPEFKLGDTTRWWFENGTIKKYCNNDTCKEFDMNGKLKRMERTWKTQRPGYEYLFSHTVLKEYHANGQLARLYLKQDEEVTEDGEKYITSVYYEWRWDENGKLIAEPDNWTDVLPN